MIITTSTYSDYKPKAVKCPISNGFIIRLQEEGSNVVSVYLSPEAIAALRDSINKAMA